MKPSKFQFKIEGYVPSSLLLEIVWKDGELLGYDEPWYLYQKPVYVKLPTPTDEMWQAFYHLLNTFHIQAWEKLYMDPDICDGNGWTLRIRFKDIHRTIDGINFYPEGYEELYAGIDALCGGFLSNTKEQE